MTFETLLETDERLSRSLRLNARHKILHTVGGLFAHSGDSWFWLVGLVLLTILGDSFWRLRGIILTGSLLVLAVIVLGLKFSIRRRRPEGKWGQIYRATDPHSFPSGHAARAFLFATIIVFIGPAWLAVAMVVWAPLVSMARVVMGVHYLSDVLAGTIIGILGGIVVFYMLPEIMLLIQWMLTFLP
jgi:undecaprenyl-diphosphatase